MKRGQDLPHDPESRLIPVTHGGDPGFRMPGIPVGSIFPTGMTHPRYPSLDKIFSLARTIWQDRGDLREAFGQIESIGYWNWLISDGIDEYPRLGELMPLPPPELTGRVVGTHDKRVFHDSGVSDAQNLFAGLQEGGFDLASGGPLLDFGCGCGRVMRVFARIADSVELHGADVDSAAMDWCTANLDYARFVTLEEHPPSPYPEGFFGGIYSFSVFSHLPEPLQRQWLEELHRITRPGAVLVLTLQGLPCFDQFVSGEAAPGGLPDTDVLLRDRPGLLEGGFLYYPYEAGRPWQDADEGNEAYGQAFVLENYIRSHWLDLFDLVDFRESPQNWQDYVVLHRT